MLRASGVSRGRGQMGFEWDGDCITDTEMGLAVEADLTFYDETNGRLWLRDRVTGFKVSFPLVEEKRLVSYIAKFGPHSQQMAVAYRLQRSYLRSFVTQMSIGRFHMGRPPCSNAEAEEAVRRIVLAYALRPEWEMLKFVPDFEVTWTA
jgi:hypothetical protein